jgi:alpha-tubulin suppressor-like RCC1 family protein
MNMHWKPWICLAWLCLIPLSGNAVTPMVSLGLDHALALRSDGTVVSWGSDQFGKLGTGRALEAATPVVVPGMTGVVAIGSGQYHSLAVRQDGTVWAWGWNADGQLGDGSNNDHSSPVQVPGLDNVATVCAGERYSMALKRDGSLWSWGGNFSGSLGIGTQTNPGSFVPVQVLGLSNVASVACGFEHTLALLQDRTVWTWGSNTQGALGLGTSVVDERSRSLPVQVPGLGPVLAVAAGGLNSAVLKQDGTVWEWGSVAQDGSTRSSPVQSPGISGAAKLSAGGTSGLAAVMADGTNWWFWDSGTTPVAQDPVGSIASIVPANWIVLLKSDGTVMKNYRIAPQQLSAMEPVAGLTNIVALAGGAFHFLALDVNGVVWTWGSDSNGQLGIGAVLGSSIPVEIVGLANIVQVSAGYGHSIAVDQDGKVWSWGRNFQGALGDGLGGSRSTPLALTSITDVQAAAAGGMHSLALKRDGSVWAWGANYAGQLGNGTYGASNSPIQVPGLDNVVGISAASDHNLALKQDGSVWAWGQNNIGQLGLGTVDPQFIVNLGAQPPNGVPAQIPGLTGVKAVVAATWSQSYALMTDGSVMAWGSNWAGQLGNGTLTDSHVPVAVTGLSGVVEIAGGYTHALARKTDGSVWGWGHDFAGELGLAPNTSQTVPVQISGVDAIQQIAAGQYVSALLRQDGLVYMRGDNRAGQLGDGTFALHSAFVPVVNSSANGFLNLNPGTAFELPPSVGVPFFVVSSGGISDHSATVSTKTKFNTVDVGTTGAVFVTAVVPPGTLAAASSPMSAAGSSGAGKPASSAVTGSSSFVLINLTDSGWKQVTNGQLLPYASGVLGDQLAAQTILNNTDTTNLKGAQFCLGYGASAEQMAAAATMRVVASIPDPNASGAAATCLLAGPPVNYSLVLPSGWNLLGNSLNQSLSVSSLYNDANTVTSVWKWDADISGWQFYTPLMDAATLQTYAAGKGYAVLATINPGEGYWVNAKSQPPLGAQSGDSYILTGTSLAKGWNLVATGNDITPSEFNAKLKAGAVPASVATLWAWDNPQSAWYFYAPSLEAQGGTALSGYIANKGYIDFATANKKLGNGTGFWVNR